MASDNLRFWSAMGAVGITSSAVLVLALCTVFKKKESIARSLLYMSWVSRLPKLVWSSPWAAGDNHQLTYLYRKGGDAEGLGCWWYCARGQQWLEDQYLKVVPGAEGYHFKRRVVVFLHGRGSHRGRRWLMQEYEKISTFMQAAMVIIDYRGFADSTGEPTQEGLIQDALTAIDSAIHDLHATEVVVWGQSLGTGVATQAVVRYHKSLEKMDAAINPVKVSTLVLEAPYTSIAEAFCDHWIYRPLRWVLGSNTLVSLANQLLPNDQWQTQKIIKDIGCTLVLIHGDADKTIPSEHSYCLAWEYERHRDSTKVTTMILPGVGHNGIARHKMFVHILRAIASYNDAPEGMPLRSRALALAHLERTAELGCSCAAELKNVEPSLSK